MNLRQSIKSEADLCVKCGLCLPHCPTYGASRDEGESPRGRIALIQALADEALPAGGRLEFHLDRCLGCRACEKACPSKVQYGRLLEAGRALVAERSTHRHRPPLTLRFLAAGGLARAAAPLRLYQRSGLQKLLRRTGLLSLLGLQRMDKLLPPLPARARLQAHYRHAAEDKRGEIALFTGCMGNALEQDALHAAIRLLTVGGYDVHVPRSQACCGALHRHAGDLAGAERLARRNLEAFNALPGAIPAYTASGCGATLSEYARWPLASDTALPAFAAAPSDLCSLLEGIDWPNTISFQTPPQRIAVHDPCSLRNVLRTHEAPYRLLRRCMPDLDLLPLAGNERCCGGAGAYLLHQPDMADQLRGDKIEALRRSGARIVLSSNPGCVMQLSAGAREAGLDIEVMHPVTLLARQLRMDSNETARSARAGNG